MEDRTKIQTIGFPPRSRITQHRRPSVTSSSEESSMLRGGVPPGGNPRQKLYHADWIWSTQCSCAKFLSRSWALRAREEEWCQSRWRKYYILYRHCYIYSCLVSMDYKRHHCNPGFVLSLPSPLPIASLGTYDPSTTRKRNEISGDAT